MGAGMLKVDEFTPASPLEVKEMVAPVTALVLKAVKPVKVAVPLTAAFVVVPFKIQVPWTGAATMLAVLATALPEASCTATTGCVAKAPPSAVGAFGCVVIASFAAAPAIICVIELVQIG